MNKKPAPLPSLREASESNSELRDELFGLSFEYIFHFFLLFADSSYHISIATVAMISMILTSLVLWFGYAYFFPHTWSGQILIKVRKKEVAWLLLKVTVPLPEASLFDSSTHFQFSFSCSIAQRGGTGFAVSRGTRLPPSTCKGGHKPSWRTRRISTT